MKDDAKTTSISQATYLSVEQTTYKDDESTRGSISDPLHVDA